MSTATSQPATRAATSGLDPRGPRFVAGLTVVVIAAALLVPGPVNLALAVLQAVLFAIGATWGVQHTPQSWLFRTVVRPRLGPPAELEDPAPPRFAQAVGLVFALVAARRLRHRRGPGRPGRARLRTGRGPLNAVFAFCLGCEVYLLLKRLGPTPA